MMGKDPSLTGRVELWRLSLTDIEQRPLQGYGYNAFWGYQSDPAWRIREEIHWDQAPSAHNGYIDLTLGLGLIGLFAYGLLNWNFAMRAYVLFTSGTENYLRWPLSFLACLLLYQLTEGNMVGGNDVRWILFCSIAFSLARVQENVFSKMASVPSESEGNPSPTLSQVGI
jgi:exopolysaccharide production protein ExoQ